MPSHPIEKFGTAAWFDRIRLLLPSGLPDVPSLVVEHQAFDTNNRVLIHTQIFSQDKLVMWVLGRVTPGADFTLIRTTDCDAGDLLGRLPAADVLIQTRVIVAGHQPTCPLGIANTVRPGLDQVTVGTVDVLFDVLDTPFGGAEFAIRLYPDGTQNIIHPTDATSDIIMHMRWETLTEWIHTETGLGHLISAGDIEFDGPMFKLSYVEGHVNWPRTPQDRQRCMGFKTVMDTYARLRQAPSYLKLMDELDEATSL